MTTKLLQSLHLSALLLASSCLGGSDSGEDAAGATRPIRNPEAPADAEALAEYYGDLCHLLERCDGLTFEGDFDTCVENRLCVAQGILEGSSITRGDLLSCSRWARGLACDSMDPFGEGPCEPLLRSLAALFDDSGSLCGGELCDSTTYCDRESPCPSCRPRAAAGESCAGPHCVRNTYCDSETLRCAPLLDEGMTCDYSFQCGPPQTFVGTDKLRCRDGTCQPPASLGEPCATLSDCAFALTCIDGVCAQRAGDGEACADTLGCASGRFCVDGACVQICGYQQASVGERCAYDLHCDEGFCDEGTSTCVALTPRGGACTSDTHCEQGLRCDLTTQICEPPAALGAACGSHDDCESGNCEAGACADAVMCE